MYEAEEVSLLVLVRLLTLLSGVGVAVEVGGFEKEACWWRNKRLLGFVRTAGPSELDEGAREGAMAQSHTHSDTRGAFGQDRGRWWVAKVASEKKKRRRPNGDVKAHAAVYLPSSGVSFCSLMSSRGAD